MAEESLKRIDFYLSRKNDDMFDDFYRSHLGCFTSTIEDWQQEEESCFAVICVVNGHKHDSGDVTPTYATVCKSPHWGSQEGIMLTSGLYDATKFDLFSDDLVLVFNHVKSKFPDKDVQIVKIPKVVCGSNPKELWSSDNVRGDFDTTGKISGTVVKEFL